VSLFAQTQMNFRSRSGKAEIGAQVSRRSIQHLRKRRGNPKSEAGGKPGGIASISQPNFFAKTFMTLYKSARFGVVSHSRS
jgi:hypothetical protein